VASCIPSSDVQPSSLLAEADAALYGAKQGGRNRSASLPSAPEPTPS
jgi:PleD family two-component response regulator